MIIDTIKKVVGWHSYNVVIPRGNEMLVSSTILLPLPIL